MVIGIIFASLVNLFSHQQIIYSKTDFAPMLPYQRWQALCRELREFPVPNHLDDKTLAMLWRQP